MPEIELKAIEKAPASPPAVAVAKEMIRWLTQSGQVSVGDKLPSERELTEIFAVGRSAVREALKTLSLLGLVEIRPGSGTYLKGWGGELPPHLLEWNMMLDESHEPDGEAHGTAMIEARVEVEVILAGLAAARRTEDDLTQIREALAQLSHAAPLRDVDLAVKADVSFHLALAAAAQSPVLAEFLNRVRNLLLVWTRRALELRGDFKGTLSEHEKIAEAISSGDVEGASEAMREHMRSAFSVFEPGSPHRNRLEVAALGQEEAQRLAQATHETVQVGVLDGTEVVYVARVDGTDSLDLISEVGVRLPATCTAIGKTLLSALSDAQLLARLEGGLTVLTANSITSIEQLRLALDDVRVTGVALDDGESNEGIRCVAAPIRDSSGNIIAGISISVPTDRWTSAQGARLTALVLDAARRMSQGLGAQPAGIPAPDLLNGVAAPRRTASVSRRQGPDSRTTRI